MSKKGGLGKFLVGAGLGVGLGVLFAPKKGEQTRKELKAKLDELMVKAKNIDVEEVKENIELKVKDLQNQLADLDKEKVAEIVKQKAKEISKRLKN